MRFFYQGDASLTLYCPDLPTKGRKKKSTAITAGQTLGGNIDLNGEDPFAGFGGEAMEMDGGVGGGYGDYGQMGDDFGLRKWQTFVASKIPPPNTRVFSA